MSSAGDKLKYVIRMTNSIKTWILDFYSDMDSEFIAKLIKFIEEVTIVIRKVLNNNTDAIHTQVQRALVRKLLHVQQMRIKSSAIADQPNVFEYLWKEQLSDDQLETITSDEILDIMEVDAELIAKQLTIIDSALFQRLHHRELFGKKKSWGAPERSIKMEKAPIITLMTERFNRVSRWVTNTIVRERDMKTRAKKIEKFLAIAQFLYQFNNFHALHAVTSGLGNNSIHRMKKTWALIPKQELQYQEFTALLKYPYANLRKKLEESPPPCIPFIGMYMTDLTFIEENSDFRRAREDSINFEKRLQYVNVIESIRQKQQKEYEFDVHVKMLQILNRDCFANLLNDDDAWEMSTQVEPS
jgi:hypothetical protein